MTEGSTIPSPRAQTIVGAGVLLVAGGMAFGALQISGEAGYGGDFIGHWVQALVYPPGLTRGWQWALGIGVLLVNALVYAVLLRRRRARGHSE